MIDDVLTGELLLQLTPIYRDEELIGGEFWMVPPDVEFLKGKAPRIAVRVRLSAAQVNAVVELIPGDQVRVRGAVVVRWLAAATADGTPTVALELEVEAETITVL